MRGLPRNLWMALSSITPELPLATFHYGNSTRFYGSKGYEGQLIKHFGSIENINELGWTGAIAETMLLIAIFLLFATHCSNTCKITTLVVPDISLKSLVLTWWHAFCVEIEMFCGERKLLASGWWWREWPITKNFSLYNFLWEWHSFSSCTHTHRSEWVGKE